jgi:D-alanyl-D-alanine dipeptidase
MNRRLSIATLAGLVTLANGPLAGQDSLPPIAPDSVARAELVDVKSLDSSIVVDARYFTSNNFTGAVLPGYEANKAFLRKEAATALARVQARLRSRHLGLKIFDGYRPVRATQAMVAWARRTDQYQLVTGGYIASRSRHNLGLAVDLTLVDLGTGKELDMGTPFDTFSDSAHWANATGAVMENRQALRRAMESEGFTQYDQEWWHYSFSVPDPVPFDMVVE